MKYSSSERSNDKSNALPSKAASSKAFRLRPRRHFSVANVIPNSVESSPVASARTADRFTMNEETCPFLPLDFSEVFDQRSEHSVPPPVLPLLSTDSQYSYAPRMLRMRPSTINGLVLSQLLVAGDDDEDNVADQEVAMLTSVIHTPNQGNRLLSSTSPPALHRQPISPEFLELPSVISSSLILPFF